MFKQYWINPKIAVAIKVYSFVKKMQLDDDRNT